MKNYSRMLALLALALALATTTSAQTYNVLWEFGYSIGASPEGQIAEDASGNLYGTTSWGGGESECGTVWELSPPAAAGGAWTETSIHIFSCTSNGYYPLGGITIDKLGNLYGTTSQGVLSGGTVFKMKPPITPGGPWSFSNIHVFASASGDGSEAASPVTLDSAGNVYGTTSGGGTYKGQNAGGIAFKLTSGVGGYKETILWNFGGPGDASYILSGLRSDASANWYGTSYYGGAYGYGSVFELSPPTGGGTAWTESVIYSFTGINSSIGEYPQGSLVIDAQGTLFGVAGGTSGTCCGAVFQMKPSTGGGWTTKALYTFTKTSDGYVPIGLTMDPQGQNLYGVTMTTDARDGNGVVFKLAKPAVSGGPWTYSVLDDFTTGPGYLKSPPLVDESGNVFGTTFYGGTAPSEGVAYEITP
jgi:uncharacterized repeat protein (TIGR03803 family)